MGCTDSKPAPLPAALPAAPPPAPADEGGAAETAPAVQEQEVAGEAAPGTSHGPEAALVVPRGADRSVAEASQGGDSVRSNAPVPAEEEWVCVQEGGKIKFTANEQSLTVVRGLDRGVLLNGTGVVHEQEGGVWVEVHAVGGKGWILAKKGAREFYVKAGVDYAAYLQRLDGGGGAASDASSLDDVPAIMSAQELNHTSRVSLPRVGSSGTPEGAPEPVDQELEGEADEASAPPCAPPLSPGGESLHSSHMASSYSLRLMVEADASDQPPPVAPHASSAASSSLAPATQPPPLSSRGFSTVTLSKLREANATPLAPPLPIEFAANEAKTLENATPTIDIELPEGANLRRRRTVAVGERTGAVGERTGERAGEEGV